MFPASRRKQRAGRPFHPDAAHPALDATRRLSHTPRHENPPRTFRPPPLATARAAHPFLCCDYNGGKVAQVSADGKIEWEYACKNPQDCWRLANGNTVFCNYGGHGHRGGQPLFFEITRDKQVVWSFSDPHLQTIDQIHILDVPGDPVR